MTGPATTTTTPATEVKPEKMTKEDVYKTVESLLDKKIGEIKTAFAPSADLEAKLRKSARVVESKDGTSTTLDISAHDPRGLTAARYLRTVAASKLHALSPEKMAMKWADESTRQRDKGTADSFAGIAEDFKAMRDPEARAKALEAGDPASAGLLVPEPVMQEVIELLRGAVVVEASGARMVPMPNGNLSMNYQSAASTARYIGERRVIPKTQPQVGRMKLSAKKLAAMVPISNDLLRFASPAADVFVRDDLVQVMALRRDLGLYRGSGAEYEPKGVRFLVDPANVHTRSLDGGFVTLETVTNDLVQMIYDLDGKNIRMVRPGWIFHPRTKWFLRKIRDGLGNFVFDEIDGGTLFGFPFKTSTQVPIDLGVGGDESEMLFADWANIIVGDAVALQLRTSDEASYTDDNGDNAGFETDETLVRAISEHDINDRQRGRSISVTKGLDWVITT